MSIEKSVSQYHNAMEPLASAEVDRQLQNLPQTTRESINKVDAIAYALNRLPAMYATTEEGWYWQQERAKESLTNLISQAASWGIKAAGRKAKVFTTPLKTEKVSEETLQKLRELLECEDVCMETLVDVVEEALLKVESRTLTRVSHINCQQTADLPELDKLLVR